MTLHNENFVGTDLPGLTPSFTLGPEEEVAEVPTTDVRVEMRPGLGSGPSTPDLVSFTLNFIFFLNANFKFFPNFFLFQPVGCVTRSGRPRGRTIRSVQLQHAFINGEFRTCSYYRYIKNFKHFFFFFFFLLFLP